MFYFACAQLINILGHPVILLFHFFRSSFYTFYSLPACILINIFDLIDVTPSLVNQELCLTTITPGRCCCWYWGFCCCCNGTLTNCGSPACEVALWRNLNGSLCPFCCICLDVVNARGTSCDATFALELVAVVIEVSSSMSKASPSKCRIASTIVSKFGRWWLLLG